MASAKHPTLLSPCTRYSLSWTLWRHTQWESMSCTNSFCKMLPRTANSNACPASLIRYQECFASKHTSPFQSLLCGGYRVAVVPQLVAMRVPPTDVQELHDPLPLVWHHRRREEAAPPLEEVCSGVFSQFPKCWFVSILHEHPTS